MHNISIPQKIFIFLKSSKILKFKNFNSKNGPSVRMYENARVTPPLFDPPSVYALNLAYKIGFNFFGEGHPGPCPVKLFSILTIYLRRKYMYEPQNGFSNKVCATSKASDQPAHTRSLIRAFASRLNIL